MRIDTITGERLWYEIDTTRYGEAADAPYRLISIAGLQFYSYDSTDELAGRLRPEPGDRLQLVRAPDNPYDANAIEVHYRDSRVMLGHVPRGDARELAPVIDDGKLIRAYALHGGNGEPWSARVILVGAGLPSNDREIHREMDASSITHEAKQTERELAEKLARCRGDHRQAHYNGHAFRSEQRDRMIQRRRDAGFALADLVIAEWQRPEPPQVPESTRGRVYGSWNAIPDGLHPESWWRGNDYKLKAGVRPWARLAYGSGCYACRQDLYAMSQVETKPVRKCDVTRAINEIAPANVSWGGVPWIK